ncbi:glycosyltransferase [Sphingomonas sp. KR1UV-12]|uniref:Glycosyltransferase n=1 Tax=Sphingomonas aurea TaxID=3063994 RepID=A0ABT9EKX6_9SPHN|nr:glycosyltransferase [Sphingomonas sp. KR1UV-12]MDP1027589.1 glycosyltransferase [Sphingomonas sp. KR1UV-12]
MMPRSSQAGERPLHILCYLHAVELGGVERTALRLCRAWGASARVTVALGRDDGWRGGAGDLDMVIAPRPAVSPRLWETLWMLAWLPRVILRERPDVLFCAGNTYSIIAVVLKLLLGRRCPPVVSKISNSLARSDLPAPVRRLHDLWSRMQGRAIDGFVGMTPAMTREAQRALGVSSGRVATIPSPLFDAAALDRLAGPRSVRTKGGRMLVAIGRLEPQKNLPLLLRAFARGRRRDDRLVIVGAGRERNRLAALIETLGLSGRAMLAGHAEDVSGWLLRADALLLSSDYEGVPAVVLEAMAAGLPVVATDCCASMAGMLAERRGVLVSPRDVDALADAIAHLTPDTCDPVAQLAFAREHAVDAAASAYLPIFRRAARERARAIPCQEHAYS